MKRWAGAVVATVGLLALAAAPASAVPGPTISPAARSAAEAAISARLTDLAAQVTLINASPALTAGDRSALTSELNSTIAGLQTLASTITSEANQGAFRAEALRILSNFRVYALVIPQVHLVRAADELTTVVVPAFQKVLADLQAQINTEQQAKVTAATASPLNDLARQIQAIGADTNLVSASLLSLTPAQWNANRSIVTSPRRRLGSARTAAVQGLADVAKIRAAL